MAKSVTVIPASRIGEKKETKKRKIRIFVRHEDLSCKKIEQSIRRKLQ